ncbi:unnamed protein product [Arctogadus glacialis]
MVGQPQDSLGLGQDTWIHTGYPAWYLCTRVRASMYLFYPRVERFPKKAHAQCTLQPSTPPNVVGSSPILACAGGEEEEEREELGERIQTERERGVRVAPITEAAPRPRGPPSRWIPGGPERRRRRQGSSRGLCSGN